MKVGTADFLRTSIADLPDQQVFRASIPMAIAINKPTRATITLLTLLIRGSTQSTLRFHFSIFFCQAFFRATTKGLLVCLCAQAGTGFLPFRRSDNPLDLRGLTSYPVDWQGFRFPFCCFSAALPRRTAGFWLFAIPPRYYLYCDLWRPSEVPPIREALLWPVDDSQSYGLLSLISLHEHLFRCRIARTSRNACQLYQCCANIRANECRSGCANGRCEGS